LIAPPFNRPTLLNRTSVKQPNALSDRDFPGGRPALSRLGKTFQRVGRAKTAPSPINGRTFPHLASLAFTFAGWVDERSKPSRCFGYAIQDRSHTTDGIKAGIMDV
jgi:hypothetical protein